MLKPTGKFIKFSENWSPSIPANTYEVFLNDYNKECILDIDGDERVEIFDDPEDFEWVDNPIKFNFKEGDKVYFPKKFNSIKTVKGGSPAFPCLVAGYTFNKQGKHYLEDTNPSIFPATQEWYEKLKPIYPDLEPPVKELTGEELCKQILKLVPQVLCEGNDYNEERAIRDNSPIMRDNLHAWNYYVPFNPYTFQPVKTVEEYFTVPTLEIPF